MRAVLCLGVGLCVGTAHAADTESPASAATQQMRAAIQAGRAVLPENLHVEVQAKRQSSSSGSCVPFRGSPATSGKCDHVVTYPNIYLKCVTSPFFIFVFIFSVAFALFVVFVLWEPCEESSSTDLCGRFTQALSVV